MVTSTTGNPDKNWIVCDNTTTSPFYGNCYTVHGELDGCQPRERAVAVAELTGGTLVALEGAGHLAQARHPVMVNGLLREFAATVVPPTLG